MKAKEPNLALFSKYNSELSPVSSQASRHQSKVSPKYKPASQSKAIGTPFPSYSFNPTIPEGGSDPTPLKDSEVILGFYANLRVKSSGADLYRHNSTKVRFNVDRLLPIAY